MHIDDLYPREYDRERCRNARQAVNCFITGTKNKCGDFYTSIEGDEVLLYTKINGSKDIIAYRSIHNNNEFHIRLSSDGLIDSEELVSLIANYCRDELVECGISGRRLRYGGTRIPVCGMYLAAASKGNQGSDDPEYVNYYKPITVNNLFILD
mgnify:CR=1 FL=1|jgi:hypothetical protein